MAQIQIGRADAIRIYQYCNAHAVHWFAAKDRHGAYVGAHAPNCISIQRYFAGCNPNIHGDWKQNAERMFGEGDFREVLPKDWLRKVFNDDTISRVQVNIEGERLSADFLRSPL